MLDIIKGIAYDLLSIAEDRVIIKKQESIRKVMGLSKDDEITNEIIEEYIKRHKLLKHTK